ncbi:MAG: energy transducer TonB [Candidatus Krumholzibacteriota bacterium]
MKSICPVSAACRRIPVPTTLGLVLLIALGACAPGPPKAGDEGPVAKPVVSGDLKETPVPEGKWRPHRLADCREDLDVPTVVERYLGICSEYFRDGSGSDGMIEMELGLAAGHRHSLMLLTLGQLYLLAGQGDPDLLPVEGPAADVGNWKRNKARLLGRAEKLLLEAGTTRLDDATVDYLLADVARAGGEADRAAALVAAGLEKCTGGRTFGILWQYQQLNKYPPRFKGGPSPEFPRSAVDKGIGGDVVLDVLLSPSGEVRQVAVVESPARSLTESASASLRKGEFEAARVGKYPIWAWLRVTTSFNLEN